MQFTKLFCSTKPPFPLKRVCICEWKRKNSTTFWSELVIRGLAGDWNVSSSLLCYRTESSNNVIIVCDYDWCLPPSAQTYNLDTTEAQQLLWALNKKRCKKFFDRKVETIWLRFGSKGVPNEWKIRRTRIEVLHWNHSYL